MSGGRSTSGATSSSTSSSSSGFGAGGGEPDPCNATVCENPPSSCYSTMGQCVGGVCVYAFADGVGCDDGDACTSADTCASGVCAGSPVVCDTPPAPVCISPTMARSWSSQGTCGSGVCGYKSIDELCLGTCSGGACTPISVSAGAMHTCAVTPAGALECWGDNYYDQLSGTSFMLPSSSTPVGVMGLSMDVIAVAAGAFHTCALTASGAVKCWGWNNSGALGIGSTDTSVKGAPLDVGLAPGVRAISAGVSFTCAITATGGAACWGGNASGQVGDGSMTNRIAPVDVKGLSSGVTAISAGTQHACAVVDGGVKCWGSNTYGQLGDGSMSNVSSVPVDVKGLSSGVIAVDAGNRHTCALTSKGSVKCWGANDTGQLGNGTMGANSVVPVDVVGLSPGAVAVTAGLNHTCAITFGGAVKCWGGNSIGELGNGTNGASAVPVDVATLPSNVVAISASKHSFSVAGTGVVFAHTCALTRSGQVACWGFDRNGELGDGSTMLSSAVPVAVKGL